MTSRFPMLALYRTILHISAVVAIGGGILIFIEEAQTFNDYAGTGFELGGFLLSLVTSPLIPLLALGLTLLIVSELIKLLLNMEDHLRVMRDSTSPQSPANKSTRDNSSSSSNYRSNTEYRQSIRRSTEKLSNLGNFDPPSE